MNHATAIPDTYRAITELLREHAQERPDHIALVAGDATLTYAELDELTDRVAASLQRDGIGPGDTIAICAPASLRYVAVFLGALRAAAAVVPLPSSAAPNTLLSVLRDAEARLLFADSILLTSAVVRSYAAQCIVLDQVVSKHALERSFDAWVLPKSAQPAAVELRPEMPFNIIYSSGTTGEPKGIVQSHAMRWAHVSRSANFGYGPHGVTLLATPLYSNTTLVVLFPTLAFGGTIILSGKFDAAQYLALAQRHAMTHTMLVPVQYQRIMDLAHFHTYDLSATKMKFCTSAPFPAALKADVLKRWPGGLVEFYGLTEGGGTCILAAHVYQNKLHTVGRPAPGHDVRLIDDAGRELPPGATGEIVGRSPGMMTGYHRRPDKTREAEWFDADGKRFIRTG
ncbi:MAG TPA: long-chain fatty acid--CoA ligase, partial [Burkholderiaceae bacterium]|nr:long-chain fatty acid--CoA ligase [Burkholderiaceae bacterium]